MKKGKKMLLLVAVTLLLSVVLAACGGSKKSTSSSSSATKKDTLYIGLTNAPGGFNALNTPDTVAQWLSRLLYPTLLDQPKSLEFKGNLATSFETTDNQTYTIKLRSGAKWSDGQAITANDVAYTLTTIANPDVETTYANYVSILKGVEDSGKLASGTTSIAGVKVVNEHELTLTMKQVTSEEYVKEMIGFNIPIVPKHVVEKIAPKELANSKFATAPTVFGGAYKFVKYEENSYVQLTANTQYYKGTPKLKNLYAKVLTGTNLVTELKSGGVDMAAGGGIGVVPVSDIASLKSDSNLTVKDYPSFNTQWMFINNDKFNKDVRLAMTYAINRPAIVKQLLKGEGEVVDSIYTSASIYKDEDVSALPYSVSKAKKYLKASGFDTSQTIELTVPTGNKVREQSANLIQQDLEAAGFKVKQVSYDFVTALANVRKGSYQIGLIGTPLYSNPDETFLWSKNGASNLGRVNDQKIESLLAAGKVEKDSTKRKAIYNELQSYFRDNAFSVGLYADSQYKVQNKTLQGGLSEFWAGSFSDIQDWTKK